MKRNNIITALATTSVVLGVASYELYSDEYVNPEMRKQLEAFDAAAKTWEKRAEAGPTIKAAPELDEATFEVRGHVGKLFGLYPAKAQKLCELIELLSEVQDRIQVQESDTFDSRIEEVSKTQEVNLQVTNIGRSVKVEFYNGENAITTCHFRRNVDEATGMYRRDGGFSTLEIEINPELKNIEVTGDKSGSRYKYFKDDSVDGILDVPGIPPHTAENHSMNEVYEDREWLDNQDAFAEAIHFVRKMIFKRRFSGIKDYQRTK